MRCTFFCMWMSNCSSTIVETTVLSSMNCLCPFVKNQLTLFAWVYLWALYAVPLTNVTILLPILPCLDQFPPTLFFFFKIIFTILVPLPFHINFRINLLISIKNLAQILIGVTLHLQINLGRIDILTILNLPVHESGVSPHLFSLSLTYLINILQFSAHILLYLCLNIAFRREYCK